REMAVCKVPFGQFILQDLGPTRRMIRGEGEFVGQDAYKTFKRLAATFYGGGPGTLVHPNWQATQAYFVALSLRQEPRADYVSYRFEFWECFEQLNGALKRISAQSGAGSIPGTAAAADTAEYYTVVSGDCLWNIALGHKITFSEVIRLNPQIKNPSRIRPGERVRLK
ncbi:MAG: LysM peptidoglycan-binding domain-containing protein, partial [Pseudoflavonifractor sp.]